MKQENIFETLLSAAVVLVAAGFLFFAYRSTGGARLSDYELVARMAHADGLTPRASDVLVSGIKVGTVSALALDPRTLLAVVHLRLFDYVKIPKDSTLSIYTGLMSPQSALSITPGHSAEMLPPGGEIGLAPLRR